jgi:hypothetical protein
MGLRNSTATQEHNKACRHQILCHHYSTRNNERRLSFRVAAIEAHQIQEGPFNLRSWQPVNASLPTAIARWRKPKQAGHNLNFDCGKMRDDIPTSLRELASSGHRTAEFPQMEKEVGPPVTLKSNGPADHFQLPRHQQKR